MPYLPPSPQSPSHSSLIKSDQRITAPQQLDFKVICWCRQNLLNWLTSALLGSSYKLAHLFNLVTVERHFEAGGDPSLTFALTLFPPQSSKLTSPLHFHTFMVTVAPLLACTPSFLPLLTAIVTLACKLSNAFGPPSPPQPAARGISEKEGVRI